jgi:hypothetical protein
MAQFKFYINDEERKDLINYILSKGTKIIPDLLYSASEYKTVKNTDDFFNYLENEQVGFFLLDDNYETEPLIISKNRFFKEPKYSIYQRKGGPYIDIVFYLGFAEDARVPYKCCIIDYYGRFIHYDSYEEFKATEPLISYFKDVVKFIKSKCKCVKTYGKSDWISKEVLEHLSQIK